MKLKKPLKTAADLKRRDPGNPYFQLTESQRQAMTPQQRDAWDRMGARYGDDQEKKRLAATSPSVARQVGMAYTGPTMPDKGKANGSCNRSACQMPLAGEPEHQFMDGNFTGGPRLHYCAKCAREFDKWDRIDRPGEEMRIKREPKLAQVV